MTEKAQRIAIAEACGWTAEQDSNGYWRAVNQKHGNAVELWLSEQNVWSVGIPDYLNDLNAMHEAEKIFNHAQYCRYISELCTLTITDNNSMYMATAAQRVEAFLRTIGKWTTNQNK